MKKNHVRLIVVYFLIKISRTNVQTITSTINTESIKNRFRPVFFRTEHLSQ